jgi:hypothetical protein
MGINVQGKTYKVHKYLEYHSVWPLVLIGTPPPPNPSSDASMSYPAPKGDTLATG